MVVAAVGSITVRRSAERGHEQSYPFCPDAPSCRLGSLLGKQQSRSCALLQCNIMDVEGRPDRGRNFT